MMITIAHRITRKLLSAVVTVARRDVSKDADVVALSHRWRPDCVTETSSITEAEAFCYVADARKIV